MSITETDLSFDDMKKIVSRGAHCGDCPEPRPLLVIAWGGAFGINSHILKCPNNIDHNSIYKVEKKTKDRLEAEKTFRRIHILKGTELEKMSETQMMERVKMARFPQELNRYQQQLVAKIAVEYGLDPLMSELLIIHGGLFVPLSARLRKAQETDEFDGINTRPATEDEKNGRRYGDEDDLWVAEIWKKGCSRPFVAFGGVKKKEVDKAIAQATANRKDPEALPLVKDSAQHAEKRAIARGLRMAFHLPLPSPEEEGSDEFEKEMDIKIVDDADAKIDEVVEGEVVSSEGDDNAPQKEKTTRKSSAAKTKVKEEDQKQKFEPPKQRGPGCPNCDFQGYIILHDGAIPCPECYGSPGSLTGNEQIKHEEELEIPVENPPQTAGELLEWVASHGKEFTKTWLLVNFSWSDKDLNNRLMECYQEVLKVTGWKSR